MKKLQAVINELKNHLSNLNTPQKIFYMVIALIVLIGHPVFIEFGLYTYHWSGDRTGQYRIGAILVCLLGVYFFKNK